MNRKNGRVTKVESIPVEKHPNNPTRTDTFASWMALALQKLASPVTITYRNQPLSEDAISYAVTKALTIWTSNPDYFLSTAHLVNWLKQTAYWTTIDGFRRAVRVPRRVFERKNLEAFADPRTSQSYLQHWPDEDRRTVWVCLQRLPPLDRFLIEGHYYDKRTDRDLAKVVYGTPCPSPAQGLRVWHQRKKAEALLRQLLEQRGLGAA
jgi:hypothetical protein